MIQIPDNLASAESRTAHTLHAIQRKPNELGVPANQEAKTARRASEANGCARQAAASKASPVKRLSPAPLK